MTWVTVGVAAVGAVKGGIDAKKNKEAAREHDAYRKEAIRYSPWTGLGDPGAAQVGNTSALSGALGGAVQGASIGNSFSGGFGGGASAPQGNVAGNFTQPSQNSNPFSNPFAQLSTNQRTV